MNEKKSFQSNQLCYQDTCPFILLLRLSVTRKVTPFNGRKISLCVFAFGTHYTCFAQSKSIVKWLRISFHLHDNQHDYFSNIFHELFFIPLCIESILCSFVCFRMSCLILLFAVFVFLFRKFTHFVPKNFEQVFHSSSKNVNWYSSFFIFTYVYVENNDFLSLSLSV